AGQGLVPDSRLAVALLVAVLVVVGGAVLAGPDEVPVPATLDERARELERLRGSIARLQGRLESVRQQVASASDRLAALEVELELQEQRVAEAVAAGALATERAAALEAGVAELERRLEAMRESLRE